LLFDEIEKAHERVLDLFPQLLSAARITLESGRVLNLEGFYVAATSNIGSPLLIGSKTNVRETLVRRVLQEARDQMRPEIFDRFDRVLVFLSFFMRCRSTRVGSIYPRLEHGAHSLWTE
jgi:ATP-dependent Clp protease ATP-binding subunit ClpA